MVDCRFTVSDVNFKAEVMSRTFRLSPLDICICLKWNIISHVVSMYFYGSRCKSKLRYLLLFLRVRKELFKEVPYYRFSGNY